MTATAPSLRDLQDRVELAELISRLYQVLDEERFDDLASIYTDDVELEFPSGAMRGLAEVAAMARRRAAGYRAMQHVNADVIIELAGNTAKVRTNHLSFHVHPGAEPTAHFDAGLVHRFDAVRTSVGWRLQRGWAEVVWLAGTQVART